MMNMVVIFRKGTAAVSCSILVVEDEAKIARLLEIELETEGYRVGIAGSGVEALDKFNEDQWDLILLDIMLPGLSGIEVLRRIRSQNAAVPVILLSAKNSVEDKVSGLDLGANDYLTKPFQIEELLARIRAALRQYQTAAANLSSDHVAGEISQDWLSAADLRMNLKTREVLRGEESIDLTPREYDLLLYFLKHPQQVLTRDQILEAVWGFEYAGETNVVDVYIRYLRKKIDQGRSFKMIQTVRGVGYVLKTP